MTPKQKVYQEVLHEIRKFIENHDLEPGDKLPSERELSEKLQAGRSSIREALRAIELLGLIETRHGEGTFLSTYRSYQTVDLLASFILQENKTKNDIILVKRIIEKEAAKIAFSSLTEKEIAELDEIVQNQTAETAQIHRTFFNCLVKKTDNLLLARIWMLLEEFSNTIQVLNFHNAFYRELVSLYKAKAYDLIEPLFHKYSN
ncbi:FadR/GntR family transcriptional regulator [Virgibacillus ndiopensis]|uniref:FadR/GntR family transcriptional regulator n=1 Tax=Virgibacillus ndiopensis TaxID=2004408 RepID=UPI001FEAA64C|nr:GntR family transcriptional regulator [Virgibacillus ndiopensis]